MPSLGASVVVVQEGMVLLVQREDFEVWALPGGTVEPGETTPQTATREVREETGLECQLTRLVGIYSSPKWLDEGDHAIVYSAAVRSGSLVKRTSETIDAGFFPPDGLPDSLVWWHRTRISDALNGISGCACLQDRAWPFGDSSREEIYEAARASGKTKPEFFNQHFGEPGKETREVKGVEIPKR